MRIVNRIREGMKSAFRDIVLIVVSILIAFTLDAAWDRYREGQDTRAILLALKSDFEESQKALEDRLEHWEQRTKKAKLLLESKNPGSTLIPRDSALLYIYNLQNYSTFDPSDGALLILQASGELDRIRSANLRNALVSWPGWIQDLKEEEADSRLAALLIQDRLAQLGVLRTVSRALTLCDGGRFRICAVENQLDADVDAALLDEVAEDAIVGELLARRQLKILDLLYEGRELHRRQAQILLLLEAELQ